MNANIEKEHVEEKWRHVVDRTKWEDFKKKLKTELENKDSVEYKHIENVLHSAAKKVQTIRKIKKKRTSKRTGCNQELKDWIKKRRQEYQNFSMEQNIMKKEESSKGTGKISITYRPLNNYYFNK